jgi:hypothetical protein
MNQDLKEVVLAIHAMHNHGVQYRNHDHEMTKGASGGVCAWWRGPQRLDRRRWHASSVHLRRLTA